MKDKEFLGWIHARLDLVHGENPNVDYMHKLHAIIEATDETQETPNVITGIKSNYSECFGDMYNALCKMQAICMTFSSRSEVTESQREAFKLDCQGIGELLSSARGEQNDQ